VCYFLTIISILAAALLFLPGRTIFPVVRVFFRFQLLIMGVPLKVVGLEQVNRNKSYIIMGNHQSLFDVFAVPAAIPMHFVAVEAAHHFQWPIWGWVTKKWGNISLPRRDLPKAIERLDKARQVIESGTSIVILPEGHRTLDGELREFKKGPFHLAHAAKADILPFAINRLFEYKSKNSWRLNPTAARVVFGKPIPYDTFKNGSVDEIRDRVYRTIKALKES
jgi:1-acyl-sn-glycerol-3-phosphate acyltransferase